MGDAVPGDVVSIRIDNPDSLETVVPMSSDLGVTHLGTLTEGRSWRVLLQKNIAACADHRDCQPLPPLDIL